MFRNKNQQIFFSQKQKNSPLHFTTKPKITEQKRQNRNYEIDKIYNTQGTLTVTILIGYNIKKLCV